MKISLAKPGSNRQLSTCPTVFTLALASGRALDKNSDYYSTEISCSALTKMDELPLLLTACVNLLGTLAFCVSAVFNDL